MPMHMKAPTIHSIIDTQKYAANWKKSRKRLFNWKSEVCTILYRLRSRQKYREVYGSWMHFGDAYHFESLHARFPTERQTSEQTHAHTYTRMHMHYFGYMRFVDASYLTITDTYFSSIDSRITKKSCSARITFWPSHPFIHLFTMPSIV